MSVKTVMIPSDQSVSEAGRAVLTSENPAQIINRDLPRSSATKFFNHTLSVSEWRKAAKFTYTRTTAPTGQVNVGGGATHVKFLRWDGTWSAVKAVSGNTAFSSADWGAAPAAPYNSLVPKFGAIVPCNSGGTVTGHLTNLALSFNQLTSFDGTGLSSLTNLALSDNQLTSFDGTGLSSLTNLALSFNQLTSVALEEDISVAGQAILYAFGNNPNLSNLSAVGFAPTATDDYDSELDLSSCNFSAEALDSIFTELGTVSTGVVVYVDNNPGAATCDPTIATSKGWTVITA